MYQKLFILVLCTLFLGGCLAAKKKDDGNFQNSNTMARGKVAHHVVRPGEEIDIDDTHEGEMIEGSAMGTKQDDDLESSGHGVGVDDEDTDEGSADQILTECQKLRAQVDRRNLLGAYVPECAENGDFKARQCSGSTGHCWCVDVQGREIAATKQKAPNVPDCSQFQIEQSKQSKSLPPDEDDHDHVIHKVDAGKDKAAPKTDEGYKVTTESRDSNIILNPTGTPKETNPNKVPGAQETGVGDTDQTGAEVYGSQQKQDKDENRVGAILAHPGILAGIIGGAVVGLLCAILLVMFIVYRMRKKDEGSYALDEPKRSPPLNSYSRSTNREFYA